MNSKYHEPWVSFFTYRGWFDQVTAFKDKINYCKKLVDEMPGVNLSQEQQKDLHEKNCAKLERKKWASNLNSWHTSSFSF